MTPTPAQLKALRAAHGLTQSQMAELVSAGLRSYQHWENGDRKMSRPVWILLQLKLEGK